MVGASRRIEAVGHSPGRPRGCSALAGLSGCGETDQFVDCNNICDAYVDCLPGAERDECIDRCQELPDETADDCDSCLDENSCLECGAECAELLAE